MKGVRVNVTLSPKNYKILSEYCQVNNKRVTTFLGEIAANIIESGSFDGYSDTPVDERAEKEKTPINTPEPEPESTDILHPYYKPVECPCCGKIENELGHTTFRAFEFKWDCALCYSEGTYESEEIEVI